MKYLDSALKISFPKGVVFEKNLEDQFCCYTSVLFTEKFAVAPLLKASRTYPFLFSILAMTFSVGKYTYILLMLLE